MASKFKVTKARYEDGEIIENTYVYRDFQFERLNHIAPGYFGRYQIVAHKKVGCMKSHSTQAAIKDAIDRYYAQKGE